MVTYPEVLKRAAHAIPPGLRLSHEEAEALTGQQITPRLADMSPQGSRILVVLDAPSETVGRIVMPETVQALQQKAAGFIVAVGPQAGLRQLGAIGNIEAEDPSDLLGLHVIFGLGAIKVIKTSIYDDDYKSQVALITTNDVWMVDASPNPLQADEEFRRSYEMTMQGQDDLASGSLESMRQEIIAHQGGGDAG